MNRNILMVAGSAIAGAVIALILMAVLPRGPAPAPSPSPTGPCSGGNPHCLVVSVITVNQNPVIQLIPDEQVGQGAMIFWEIGTPGYTFGDDNAVQFSPTKPVNPAPLNEFTNCKVMPSTQNTQFRCQDNHNKLGPMGYTVTLQGSPGHAAPPSLDPWVVNN